MKPVWLSLWLCAALNVQSRAATIHFDDAPTGQSPAGWQATQSGSGAARWTVERDDSAPSRPNVLKQSGQATFAVCLKSAPAIRDGFVEVKFKAVAGKEDQAGGVVWRAEDTNNYYICRANALEDNVTLYKTVAGKRTALDIVGRKGGYGVKEKVAGGQWHTLRVEFAGRRFKVFFNGRHLFEVEDDTFQQAGRTGLWTKADSLTLFDDFQCNGK